MFHSIRAKLRPWKPRLFDDHPKKAAVSLIFKNIDGVLHILWILRAIRKGDPWSGQMAFPGGHWEPSDPSLLHTVIRETWEELGIRLDPTQLLGILEPEYTPRFSEHPILVLPFVFQCKESSISPNNEVQHFCWIPWHHFSNPLHQSEFQAYGHRWPCVLWKTHCIWGMSLRIVQQMHKKYNT